MKRRVLCSAVAAWSVVMGLALAWAGCVPASTSVVRPQDYDETIRVACVGDSITYGAGIEDRQHNHYPAQLARMLGPGWEVRNFGVSGATLLRQGDKPYWKEPAYEQVMAFNPHVVIIKLGTNDSKPQNWKYADQFVEDYKELIRRFAALPAHPRIWICLPVPVYEDRWGIREAVVRDEVIPRVRQVATDMGVGLIDLYTALSGKPEMFPDGVHPNATGAGVMARTIVQALTGKNPPEPLPGGVSSWHGYERHDFEYDGRKCIVVVPARPHKTRPWIWRARFFGHEPRTDLALLSKGFFIAYMDVADMYGGPEAVAHWNAFYEYLTGRHGFAPKVALEGMSRGGLIVYNWAAANPRKVACIYADAPVCDIRSWPGGLGKGKGDPTCWRRCLDAYGLSQADAKAFDGNPIDRLEPLAAAGVPLLNVCGAADQVVPVDENTAVLAERYRKLGGSIRIVLKPGLGHHPHSLADPSLIVNFILRHTLGTNDYIRLRNGLNASRRRFTTAKEGRVAFLGGSITEMEGYRPRVMQQIRRRFPQTRFDFINAGIASTCSTAGAFRLAEHVLSDGPVDLLFVEFAVNDDQDANHSPTECIRAMEGIVRRARRQNPQMDIVFLYTANQHYIEMFQQGRVPHQIAAHEKVATCYGLPAINLAADVAERMKTGEFDWKTFGGVHPAAFGNALYAEAVDGLFKAAWDVNPGPPRKSAYDLPARPLDPFNYGNGRLVDIHAARIHSGWRIEVPPWNTIKGQTRKQFNRIELLVADQPGARLVLPFKGRAVGVFVVAGPDAGILEYRIDQGPFQRADLYHRFSRNLHYPRTVLFADTLEPGNHRLELRTTDRKNPDSTGTAARIVWFVVNGPDQAQQANEPTGSPTVQWASNIPADRESPSAEYHLAATPQGW